MLIMNNDGMQHLLSNSVCPGCRRLRRRGTGRTACRGQHGLEIAAQVLTYSRARGVFAGVSLNGARISFDKNSTRQFYGHMVTSKASLTGEVEPPANANAFLTSLAKWAQEAAK